MLFINLAGVTELFQNFIKRMAGFVFCFLSNAVNVQIFEPLFVFVGGRITAVLSPFASVTY